ncbi:MAG: hypothetical protein IKD27_08980 [Oscillospiraceae bacterium]|nr:hypothetical protein [Oscillospiraceae bacterium]
MKLAENIMKIGLAIAAVAGIAFLVVKYLDAIKAWLDKLCPACEVEEEAVEEPAEELIEEPAAEEAVAEEAPAEEPAAEEAAPAAEEVVIEEGTPVAEEADFEA